MWSVGFAFILHKLGDWTYANWLWRGRTTRYVLPSGKLDTHGLRFQPGQSLLFGGLARIDFVEGNVLLANWFCSDRVKVHTEPPQRSCS